MVDNETISFLFLSSMQKFRELIDVLNKQSIADVDIKSFEEKVSFNVLKPKTENSIKQHSSSL